MGVSGKAPGDGRADSTPVSGEGRWKRAEEAPQVASSPARPEAGGWSRGAGVPCLARASPRPGTASASGPAPSSQLPGYFGHRVPTPARCWRPSPPSGCLGASGLSGCVFAAGGPRALLPRPCRVLVLLNPRGGKGKALQLFRSHVQPLLVQADVAFTLVLTGGCGRGARGSGPCRRAPALSVARGPCPRRAAQPRARAGAGGGAGPLGRAGGHVGRRADARGETAARRWRAGTPGGCLG